MRKTIKRISLPARDAEQAPGRDAAPCSTAELRLSLMRKLLPVISNWRKCPDPACRRNRRCATKNLECLSVSQRSCSEEQGQAALADLQRALKRRQAERNDMEKK